MENPELLPEGGYQGGCELDVNIKKNKDTRYKEVMKDRSILGISLSSQKYENEID